MLRPLTLLALAASVAGLGLGPAAGGQAPSLPTQLRIPTITPASPFVPRAPEARPPRLKIVTYNIASGAGPTCPRPGLNSGAACFDWKSVPIDFEGIARHILDQAPDVVFLQEVHDRYIDGRHPQINQPAFWRQRLGMAGEYLITSKAWNFWGQPLGTAGDMILSRYPIVQRSDDRQPFDRGIDFGIGMIGMGATQSPKSKMSMVIDVNGTRVRLASVHLPGRTNTAPTLEYLNWLDTFPEPVIVGGDFNRAWTDFETGAFPDMRTAFARYDLAPNSRTTDDRLCPGDVDYILVRRGQAAFTDDGEHGKVVGACPTMLSDHPLAYATVQMQSVPIFNPGFENGLQKWSVWSPQPTYRAILVPWPRDGAQAALQYGDSGFIWRDLTVVPGRE